MDRHPEPDSPPPAAAGTADRLQFETEDEVGPGFGLLIGLAIAAGSIYMWYSVIHGTFPFRGGGVGIALVLGPLVSCLLLVFGIRRAIRGHTTYHFYGGHVLQSNRWGTTRINYDEIEAVVYSESRYADGSAISLTVKLRAAGGRVVEWRSSVRNDAEPGLARARAVAAIAIESVVRKMEAALRDGRVVPWYGKAQLTPEGIVNTHKGRTYPWHALTAAAVKERPDALEVFAGHETAFWAMTPEWNVWPGYEVVRRRLPPAAAAAWPRGHGAA